ncbi:hypothetical protein ABIE18_002020 [Arthrobacter sp. 2762]
MPDPDSPVLGWGVRQTDTTVHMVRYDSGQLTRISLRGNTERMISFVTVGVVVLTKRVA